MKESVSHLSLLKEKLPLLLKRRERRILSASGLTLASVLIPLFEKKGSSYLLLIKRSRHVKYHPYQISFPGGVLEGSDSNVREAALREAYEEIGVMKNDVEVLGLFDDYESTSNFRITSVVGIIPYPYPFTINPREVEMLVEVPLSTLLPQRKEKVLTLQGKKRHTFIFISGPFTIWGVTARIIRDFLDLLKKELL